MQREPFWFGDEPRTHMPGDKKTDPALVLIAIVLAMLVTVSYIGDRSTNPDRYQSSHSLMATSNPPS
jgi:hypothetical protein